MVSFETDPGVVPTVHPLLETLHPLESPVPRVLLLLLLLRVVPGVVLLGVVLTEIQVFDVERNPPPMNWLVLDVISPANVTSIITRSLIEETLPALI